MEAILINALHLNLAANRGRNLSIKTTFVVISHVCLE